jgi:hypothetical protein
MLCGLPFVTVFGCLKDALFSWAVFFFAASATSEAVDISFVGDMTSFFVLYNGFVELLVSCLVFVFFSSSFNLKLIDHNLTCEGNVYT